MLSAREVTLAARLEAKDRELVALRAVEELNPESGIGMDKHGAPISKLSVRIVRATDLPEHKIKVFTARFAAMTAAAGPHYRRQDWKPVCSSQCGSPKTCLSGLQLCR